MTESLGVKREELKLLDEQVLSNSGAAIMEPAFWGESRLGILCWWICP